jgi:hypothetical protein
VVWIQSTQMKILRIGKGGARLDRMNNDIREDTHVCYRPRNKGRLVD